MPDTRRSYMVVSGLWMRYTTLIAAAVVAVCFLDFGNFIQIYSSGAIAPRDVYILLLALMVPIVMLNRAMFMRHLAGRQSLWVFGFLMLNLGHWAAFVYDGDYTSAELTATRIQYLALIVLLLFAVRVASAPHVFMCCAALASMLSAFQVIDFFAPGNFVPIETEGFILGRAGSTLINANKAAESLILLTVFGMAALSPVRRLALMFVVLPGVFLSFSRSGLVAWFMVLILGFLFGAFPRRAAFFMVPILVVVLGVIGSVLPDFILSVLDPSALADIYARLSFWSSGDLGDDSAQERLMVAAAAMESFLAHPIVGNGSGYTFFWAIASVAPHNQHLLTLAEYGLTGYVFFLVAIRLSLSHDGLVRTESSRAVSVLLAVVLLWFSVFTHNMFDHLYWLLSLGLLTCQADRRLRLGVDNHSASFPGRGIHV
jgi:hypothetical protein